MKFKIGDDIDKQHCEALKHEFLCCHDAFKKFEAFATVIIIKGSNPWLSYKAHNAYSKFVHHLYEFMVAAYARDAGNTKITNKKANGKARAIEAYINRHAQRVLTNRRAAILTGAAPSYENDLSYYPETIPRGFAEEFRRLRNRHAHATHQRSALSLASFYETHHKYLHLLYKESLYEWGLHGDEIEKFVDLKEITDFSIVITPQDA